MIVKPDEHKPQRLEIQKFAKGYRHLLRFCNRVFPVYNYPGMSHKLTGSGKMKIWFTLQAVKGMTRRQERRSNWRAMCTVYCREGTAL